MNSNQELVTITEVEDTIRDKYVRWFVMHPEERALAHLPLSPQEFTERYHTTLQNIRDIHISETFSDDVYKATQQWAKRKSTEMVHLLVENYKRSKNPREFDSYVKFVESNKEQNKELQGNQINFFNLSPQQYEQILKRESKRYTNTGDSSVSAQSGSGQPDEFLPAD
jgi:hypothetical protein